jgi:hypothetical protein
MVITVPSESTKLSNNIKSPLRLNKLAPLFVVNVNVGTDKQLKSPVMRTCVRVFCTIVNITGHSGQAVVVVVVVVVVEVVVVVVNVVVDVVVVELEVVVVNVVEVVVNVVVDVVVLDVVLVGNAVVVVVVGKVVVGAKSISEFINSTMILQFIGNKSLLILSVKFILG